MFDLIIIYDNAWLVWQLTFSRIFSRSCIFSRFCSFF